MLGFLTSFIDSVINSNYSVISLSLIAIAEAIFLPLPPDIFLIPLSLLNPKLAIFYASVTTASSIIGGVIGYTIGNKGGKTIVYKFISKERLTKVKHYYNKYDVWAILIAAFSPIPYKVFTISAGLFDLNLKKFIIASIIGRGARFFLIAVVITIFGPSINLYLFRYFEIFTVVVVVLLVGGFFIFNWIFKRIN
ncbi:DedA family protein [Patescibacteria group bacterium]|nr:DedA family protein [Patescibacteria group bacterium]